MIDISIIIPAFNEEGNLSKTVKSILDFLPEISSNFEVLVIDDGSTDRTAQIAQDIVLNEPRVILIRHEKNKGFGESEKTGITNAKYKFVSLIPADGQFDVKDLNRYLPYLEEADIVVGYRKSRKDSIYRRLNTWFYNFFFRIFFGLKTRDIDWVKVYNRKIFDEIKIDSISALVDAEIAIKAVRKGFRIKEVEVPHYPRVYGQSSGGRLSVILRAFTDLIKLWKRLRHV